MGHKANLDILRSFAVCTVLIDHLVPTLEALAGFHNHAVLLFTAQIGHAGVLAFFVHTSLVLMYSLERMYHTQDHVTLKFYVRRFFRIYPLAIFCILMALALHIPSAVWRKPDVITPGVIFSNLILMQNLIFKKDILTPLWSLPYEVQMYLVLPGLFLIACKKKGATYLGGLIVLFSLAGTLLSFRTGHLNMAAYIPCFLSGVLCYSLRNRIKPFIPSIFWIPFVVVMITLFCLTNMRGEPVFWIGWLYSVILGLAINTFKDSSIHPVNWAANKMALYSYGVYLLHVPVLYLLFVKLHMTNLIVTPILFFILTVGASVITYHLLEHPAINLGLRLSSKPRQKPVVEELAPSS